MSADAIKTQTIQTLKVASGTLFERIKDDSGADYLRIQEGSDKRVLGLWLLKQINQFVKDTN